MFKGKKSNVFGVTITYPPTDEEKDDIKRINTEDIFPDDLAAPSLEEGEECKHGNKFSPKLEAINIESRNMIIHHSQDTKDSRSSSLVLYALSTEGNVCDCKKHFTGNIVGSISIVLHLILLLLLLNIIETYFAGEDKYSPTPNIIVVIIETYSAGEDKKLLRVSPLPTKKRNLKKS